jgi:hypothetical protein
VWRCQVGGGCRAGGAGRRSDSAGPLARLGPSFIHGRTDRPPSSTVMRPLSNAPTELADEHGATVGIHPGDRDRQVAVSSQSVWLRCRSYTRCCRLAVQHTHLPFQPWLRVLTSRTRTSVVSRGASHHSLTQRTDGAPRHVWNPTELPFRCVLPPAVGASNPLHAVPGCRVRRRRPVAV